MVTCRKCGNPLAKECSCYSDLEATKLYTKLASNEVRVIDSIRKYGKKLFIESESTGIKKEAGIKKLNHFGITASETFTGKEVGKESPFFMLLKEENDDVVYRRRFDDKLDDKLDDNDTITIGWTLESRRNVDRFWFKLTGKIFGNKH